MSDRKIDDICKKCLKNHWYQSSHLGCQNYDPNKTYPDDCPLNKSKKKDADYYEGYMACLKELAKLRDDLECKGASIQTRSTIDHVINYLSIRYMQDIMSDFVVKY